LVQVPPRLTSPRLYHLTPVESRWADNAFSEQGRSVHVDAADAEVATSSGLIIGKHVPPAARLHRRSDCPGAGSGQPARVTALTTPLRSDLAGLNCRRFSDWLRPLVGHGPRQHRALYKALMTTGRWAPEAVEEWREVESVRPGTLATLAAVAAAVQHPPVVESLTAHEPGVGTTTKLVIGLADGRRAEAVIIPMRGGRHATVCVSSQVGCKMGCTFCHTARLGLVRNLTAAEIVGQVLAATAHVGARPRNVVFMGMGEPLDNLDAVAEAVAVLTDQVGLGLAPRHVTISTVGRVDQFARMAELRLDRVNLAVSLGSADDAVRSRLMPVNRSHDLAALKAALLAYPLGRGRRVLIGYVLLAGVNDALADADRLADWLVGLPALVNLIPFNDFAGSGFRSPEPAAVEAFRARLDARGLAVRLRMTKGDEVMAACGQLGDPALRRR